MTFNGLVGQLQRNEVDMVVADLAVTRDREQVIDFTYPFHFGYSTVLLRRSDPEQYRWRKLLDPFKWQVIATIGVALVASSVVILLLERNNLNYRKRSSATPVRYHCAFHSYIGTISALYASLLNEAVVGTPQSTTGRSFLSAWWLLSIVVSATYCGNLIAFLTVTKEKMPFDTLAQMADVGGQQWGTIGGTLWEDIFMVTFHGRPFDEEGGLYYSSWSHVEV
ncbi:glutamate receptor-like [Mya arenaria]|uniref:glutamate receptor-like n=1 Tax=Mya arenaria TaxID=6604 RepID=UPI0022E13AEF|nr:glutamate receptor-like [Mya arenaria]